MTQNTELTRKQQRLITAMLSLAGSTLTEAARQAGISDDTARRYLALPHVKAAYDEAAAQVFAEELRQLQNSMGLARQTLIRNLSEETPNAQQVAAAKILLDKGIEACKISELETRLAELETRLNNEKGNHHDSILPRLHQAS